MLRQLVTVALLLATNDVVSASTHLYVSVAGDKRIASFRIDSDSGDLTHEAALALQGEPGALTTDPRQRFLFASIRSTGELASFRITPQSGHLRHISTVPAGPDPAHLSTDRTGRFLLAAYYQAGKVTVHRIGEDGALSDEALQSVVTAEKAHAIAPDPSNRFVFVPHTAPNAIFQFTFEPSSGRLTANAAAKVTTPMGTGPRHLAFHPTRPIAYIINEQGSSVTAYHLDSSAGTLAPYQTITTLPAGFQGTNACAEIKVHPSGKYLYASNRGDDSIACFSIDASGKLAAVARAATEKTPRSFDLEPTGRFAYAAGEGSGKIASYRVDAETGGLVRLETYDVGKQPWWVMAVDVPRE